MNETPPPIKRIAVPDDQTELVNLANRLRRDGHGDLADQYTAQAERAEQAHAYLSDLGQWLTGNPYDLDSHEDEGRYASDRLVADGWTPPPILEVTEDSIGYVTE